MLDASPTANSLLVWSASERVLRPNPAAGVLAQRRYLGNDSLQLRRKYSRPSRFISSVTSRLRELAVLVSRLVEVTSISPSCFRISFLLVPFTEQFAGSIDDAVASILSPLMNLILPS